MNQSRNTLRCWFFRQENALNIPKLSQKINELFLEYKTENHPGVQLGIVHKGSLIFQHVQGLADMERNVEISQNTLFDIASIAKHFVAACILMLEEEGKINTEDGIGKYISRAPQSYSQIRVSDLLSHTSGIKDYMDILEESGLNESNAYKKNEILDMIFDCPLEAAPGTEYSYSNSNYFLLMLILEEIEKISLAESARERIFLPLGMNSTCFYDDHRKILRDRALSYKRLDNGSFQNFPYIFDIVGDTGLLTNVQDLIKWDACFYSKNVQLLSERILSKLNTKQTLRNGEEICYSFGLFIQEIAGYKAECHWGEAAGYISEMVRVPEIELTVICLSNFLGAKYVAYEILESIIGDL